MHTAHIILVKADTYADAISTIQSNLDSESNFARWAEWAVVGGESIGSPRYTFSNVLYGGEWQGANEFVVSLENEEELFYKVLDNFKTYRDEEFDSLKYSLQDFDFSSLEIEVDGYHPELHSLVNFAKLANGEYDYNSRIYDLEHWCITTKYFDGKVAGGEKNWFAVLVDFHF